LGKQIAPLSEFVSRIRAAVSARAKIPGCDIVLIARTDAAQGYGLKEALTRLKAAVAEGADGKIRSLDLVLKLNFSKWHSLKESEVRRS